MGNIIESFCETFGVEEYHERKRDKRHQLTGSKNKRISNNFDKISSVFDNYDVTFDSSDCVYNISTKTLYQKKI